MKYKAKLVDSLTLERAKLMNKDIIEQLDALRNDLRILKNEILRVLILNNSENSHSPSIDNLITNHAAKLRFGLSEKSLYNMRKSGKLPFTRIGFKIFYKSSDIRAMIDENYVCNKTNQKKSNHD